MSKISLSASFQEEIYSIVRQIPKGKVLTYGQLARFMNKPSYARLIGRIMSAAPDDPNLPCHRVVNSSGRIAPGCPEHRERLEKEGIKFKKNGNVDMKEHNQNVFDVQ